MKGVKQSKIKWLLLLLVILIPCTSRAEFSTGIHLSLGQLHYSFKDFSNTGDTAVSGEPNDLFLGFSLHCKNRFEINIVYNRATGEIKRGFWMIDFDKDGFGLDLGKVISIDLFKRNSLSFSAEFAAGFYTMIYPILNIRQTDLRTGKTEEIEDSSHHQTGFYWSIRLKNLIGGKLSIDLGFKSLIPFSSNELVSTLGEEILLYKNFLTVGISF